jgi:hypothetical protein
MTNRKPLQIYLNKEERKILEQVKHALNQTTLSKAAKQCIMLVYKLKDQT